MNFEAAYLAALAVLIANLGGVVPTAPALNFRDSELAHLRAIVLAVGGTLPGAQLNYHDLVLANWRAAIVAKGGTVPGVQLNFRLSHLLHVQAFQLALGNSVAFSGNYHEALLQLARSGLNFSALTALPSGRQSAVTTAANAAAATLSVTPQSIIDALSVGRGLCSMLPNDGCLLASSGGAVTVQGDPVGAIRSWTGVELATQSNASLRPVSGADGLFFDNKEMSFGNLSSWTAGELAGVFDADTDGTGGSRIWRLGNSADNSHLPQSTTQINESFGHVISRTSINESVLIPNKFKKLFYNVRAASGQFSMNIDNKDFGTFARDIGFPSDARIGRSTTPDLFYKGTISALSLNLTLYNAAQRAAISEFCRNYYGVTY